MNKEDLTYLNLLYQSVEDVDKEGRSGKFYKLYNPGDPGFLVCDSDAKFVSDLRFASFDLIGPLVAFSLYTPKIEIDEFNQEEIEMLYKTDKTDFYLRYRVTMSFMISQYDLQKYGLRDALKNCEVYSEISCHNIYKLADGELWAVKNSMSKIGLFDDTGKIVAPFVYSKVFFSKKLKNGNLEIKMKAPSCDNNMDKYGDWMKLEYDVSRKKFDYYFLLTLCDGRYAAATSYTKYTELVPNEHYRFYGPMVAVIDKYKVKFRLMDYCGRLLGKEYESIRKSKMHTLFGKPLFEVRDNSDNRDYYGKHSYGYIAENGFELVEPNKYFIASPIGDNGLFEVTRLEDVDSNKPRKQSHGIWDGLNQVMVESIRNDTAYIEKHLSLITILMAEIRIPYKPVMRFIVGNDGKLYDRLEKAFEIYRDRNNPKLHILIVYGKKYYCDIESWDRVKILKNKIDEREYSWIKVA